MFIFLSENTVEKFGRKYSRILANRMPPFPKRAPVKPYMIDNTSTVRVWAGSLVWTAGFVAFLDYAFDVFKSVREGSVVLDVCSNSNIDV